MNKYWNFIFLMCSLTYNASSQSDIIKNYVVNDAELGQYFEHQVQSSQTLYSLSRYYHIPLTDLQKINRLSEGQGLSLNQKLKIPFKKDFLESLNPNNARAIPLYYTAVSKDNIFRISKVYFNQSIEQMMRRNKLEGLEVHLNQEFMIGWYLPADELSEEISVIQEAAQYSLDSMVFVKKIGIFDTLVATPVQDIKYRKLKGIAYWNKNSSDRENLFALHKTASKNSLIKIYNPLLNRTVWAQVIGSFDESLYDKGIDVIISPRVAQSLGMNDKRFQVELEFTE